MTKLNTQRLEKGEPPPNSTNSLYMLLTKPYILLTKLNTQRLEEGEPPPNSTN